jgi:glycosyltransferase involved in cell wall biosynthesis
MPKYSIVMPVYGVEEFLPNAVQSVLNQTVQDYELILVDDESPDQCPQMCDEYARKYPQIKVVHQKNTGLAGARNSGFAHISGRYVYFLDSDDTIQPDTLAYFDRVLAAEPDTDYIFTDFQRVKVGEQFKAAAFDRGYEVFTDIFKVQEKFMKREFQILAPGSLFNVQWYRRNNREFLNNPFGEDQVFIFYSLLCVHKMVYIRKPLYNYLTRSGSIMTGSDYRRILKAYPFFTELSRVYNTSNNASPVVKRYLLPRWCSGVCHSAAKNSTYKEFGEFLRKVDADEYMPQLLRFPSAVTRFLALTYVISKPLFYFVNGGRKLSSGGVIRCEFIILASPICYLPQERRAAA